MKWEHRCSFEWLEARQSYLNASEIKQLIPYTATGRDKKITDIDRAAVLAKKQKILTEDDCMSYGAAARGHILEPYAIMQYTNKYHVDMYHWDDCLIYDADNMIAYSPDGLDIPHHEPCSVEIISDALKPEKLIEVKCYGDDKHIKCILGDDDKLEERWQIATTMFVSPSIENASLVFFNPSLRHASMGVVEYDRGDLSDEIAIIGDVVNDWKTFMESYLAEYVLTLNAPYIDEHTIYAKYEAEQRLNP